jgi:hypothetical protein
MNLTRAERGEGGARMRSTIICLLAVGAAGCTTFVFGDECDCPAYQRCEYQECVKISCSSAAGCPSGTFCLDGTCGPVECRDHDDCVGGRCVEGGCYPLECSEGEQRACSTLCGVGAETCVSGVWRGCDAPLPSGDGCGVVDGGVTEDGGAGVDGGIPGPDLSALVDNLTSVTPGGAPGPLIATGAAAFAFIAGDDDSSPAGAAVGMAGEHGQGRFAALGHDGFFSNEALLLFDNLPLARNLFAWLSAPSGRQTVRVAIGHQEWFGEVEEMASLFTSLEGQGYLASTLDGTIDAAALATTGVLLVGNAWGDMTPDEVSAIGGFVQGGGGVLLLGLGWSWLAYQGALEQYPMNAVGGVFGLRWVDGTISDPSDQHDGAPLFHVFWPASLP